MGNGLQGPMDDTRPANHRPGQPLCKPFKATRDRNGVNNSLSLEVDETASEEFSFSCYKEHVMQKRRFVIIGAQLYETSGN